MNYRRAFTYTLAAPLAVAALALSAPARAQETDSVRIDRLERQLEAVTREIELLRLGSDVVVADTSSRGFGPAASKVYGITQGVSIGGYGELLYERYASSRQDGAPAGRTDQFDALRAIVYVGYKFNDRLLFNSEIEVEHGDEIFLEFAYVDYLLTDAIGLRAGLLLAPLGLVNELHEPPIFLGTERSVTESRIIPTTWRENGVGIFGDTGPLSWRAYVMNSFDGSGFGATGLRGGRQKGSRALAEDMGVAGRVDYVAVPGLIAGASAYYGETAHGAQVAGEEVGGGTFVWDAHVDYKVRGFDLRALVAGASLNDVPELNQLNGLVGAEGIGTRMLGWYVQGGYDVLRGTGVPHQLIPYVRHERVDTQRSVALGFSVDPTTDLRVTSIGAAWKPATQVVFELDYQLHANLADTGVDQVNFHIGWLF